MNVEEKRDMVGHLLWMCQNMYGPKDPFWYRWLGFIQAGTVFLKLKDIREFTVDGDKCLDDCMDVLFIYLFDGLKGKEEDIRRSLVW